MTAVVIGRGPRSIALMALVASMPGVVLAETDAPLGEEQLLPPLPLDVAQLRSLPPLPEESVPLQVPAGPRSLRGLFHGALAAPPPPTAPPSPGVPTRRRPHDAERLARAVDRRARRALARLRAKRAGR